MLPYSAPRTHRKGEEKRGHEQGGDERGTRTLHAESRELAPKSDPIVNGARAVRGAIDAEVSPSEKKKGDKNGKKISEVRKILTGSGSGTERGKASRVHAQKSSSAGGNSRAEHEQKGESLFQGKKGNHLGKRGRKKGGKRKKRDHNVLRTSVVGMD